MPRAGLTRDAVVTLALETIDELGLDGLTLAEIAGRAGVKVPSLYKHIASLEVLRSAVATEATRELAQELRVAAIGVSRTAALESLAHAYRGYALRHPGRYAATQRAPLPGEAREEAHALAAAQVQQVVSATLRGYDIADDQLIDATRALRAALHGFCALENGGGFALPANVSDSFSRMLDGLDRMLSSWPA
ncbi:TetR-like C-terminal domain-containing protein [Microbacterium laevaniformans]|uniref:Tetracycline repressor protein class H n=1 Tax=Microbacterium laevaniformans TaxID=36807 RepID=A0A150HFD3_9MICO|nr:MULTISPECIES: TetR/AcrR family transcriptional regulator [Microbacterium]KXZ60837.1 Tetracycline repressor protein class H [Microbacterium laevaniformans]MBM7753388.1 AcrR family transcriptional regulator [Microbacterium laevaniformans]OJU44503.1 MAG: TetR family transcriptional regulator [Microbacterium sp. 69-7]GLJ65503.1 transcriptional regulator [Microbacterium laevaniformans]